MKITNKKNKPQILVNAVEKIQNEYTGGDSDYTPSTLNNPPFLNWMLKNRKNEIEVDIMESLWMVFGSAVHYICEMGASDQYRVEQRVYIKRNGLILSGQYDVYGVESKVLQDYKVCKVWSTQGSAKREWTQQLNLLRFFMHNNNMSVKKMEIIAILKNWNKFGPKKDKNYPQDPVPIIPIPKWTIKETSGVLDKLLDKQEDARKKRSLSDIKPCTSLEKWKKGDKYLCTKPGNKRASKNYASLNEALDNCPGWKIKYEPAVYTRCEEFCLVRSLCPEKKKQEKHRETIIDSWRQSQNLKKTTQKVME